MKFWLLFYGVAVVLSLTTADVNAASNIPHSLHEPGPLYDALQLLIAGENLNALMIWNETQVRIEQNYIKVQTALDFLHNYEHILNSKLQQLNETQHLGELEQCYRLYERQIARFNRDLISKYRICGHALNSSLSQLEREVRTAVYYIQDAAIAVQELWYDCNVTDLRRSDGERAANVRVTMCVISRLGEIQQRMLEATQIYMEIIGRIVINDLDVNVSGDESEKLIVSSGDSVCLEFQNLKQQFEMIYDRILHCMKDV